MTLNCIYNWYVHCFTGFFIVDFDAVSSSSAPLKVAKDRAKPMARRRAPTRVSKLAHMNTETSDAYIEEQAKAPPRLMSPRPVSMVY